MKTNDLVQAMGLVDEKYVEEALRYKSTANKRLTLWRTIAIAACAVLAVSAALGIVGLNAGRSGKYSDTSSSRSSDSFYYSAQDMDVPAEGAGNYYAAQDSASFKNASEAGNGTPMFAGEVYEDAGMAYESDADYEEIAEYETGAASSLSADANGMAAAGGSAEEDGLLLHDKKIIYNVYMDMQTREFDSAVRGIESVVDELGGYCESQNISNESSGYRNASYTIRIPAERLEEFLNRAGQISTVTYMSRSAQDVSESYYDTQSRLESARTKLARLQDLMKDAQNMEDLITIESAITDVEWEIDNYGSTIRYYDSNVSYSTVTLNMKEVYEVVVDEVPMSFGERIGSSFHQGIRSIGMFFKNLVIWFAASWFWVIVVIIIIVILVIIIKKAAGRNRSRKHKKDDQE